MVARGTWRLANCGRTRSYAKVDSSCKKVVDTANPVDILTKYLAGSTLRQHLEALELWQEAGRAESAPKVSAEVEAWLASPHTRRVGEVARPYVAEGSKLPVGVATDSSQFPGEIEVPEVSVDVAKGSVQIPGVAEDSGVLIGVATDSTRLPEGD